MDNTKNLASGRVRSAAPRIQSSISTDSYIDTSSLPMPDKKTVENYFSENAQLHYNQTYRSLLHHAELLPGGRKELLSIVKETGDPGRELRKAKEKLVRFGVITPGETSSSSTPVPTKRLGPMSQLVATRPQTAGAISSSKANSKRPQSAAAAPSSAAAFIARKLERLSKEEAMNAQQPILPRMGMAKLTKNVPLSPILGRGSPVRNLPLLTISASPSADQKWTEAKSIDDVANFAEDIVEDNDSSGDEDYNAAAAAASSFGDGTPASPRSIFLAGCVRYGLAPRSIAMLRKRISPVVNLAHMSIGNQTAILLAEAMDRMPYLQTLNLADNNLDDVGLTAIIRCVAKHSTLEVLDISQNTVSFASAKALGEYVGRPTCFLKSLRLSSAGIDDKECASFVKVLMNNRMLKELDLSKNLLGKDENLNVVMPDFLTGGESLAHLLRYSTCPLETLNLHWNMIRLEGAEILCDSIRNNSYLTDLNLSYNSLGSRAVCLLGMALIDNNRLKRLNLSNNGIDSQGAITLSVGMRENQSLTHVVLSGNPLGDQGARALMKVMIQEGHRLTVETEDCDISTRQNALALHIDNPLGDYLLDLAQPHERAFAYELFDIIARDANIDVSIFDLYLTEQSGDKVARSSHTNTSNSAGAANNSRPKSPTKDRNANAAGANNAANNGDSFDPLAAAVRQLGPLTASYTIARFDEAKKRYVLSAQEREEEAFFAALAPLHEVSPVILMKTVRHYMIPNSDSFPLDNLRPIFDDLLSRRRRFKQSTAATATAAAKGTATSTSEAMTGPRPALFASDSLDESLQGSLDATQSTNLLGVSLPPLDIGRADSLDALDSKAPAAFLTGLKPAADAGKIESKGSVDEDSVRSSDVLLMPHEEVVRRLADETRRLLDPRGSGVIDNDVFIEYITERAKGARDRLRQIRNLPRCAAIQVTKESSSPSRFAAMKNLNDLKQSSASSALASSPIRKFKASQFVRYIPPISGWLRLRLVEAFHMSSPLDDDDEDDRLDANEERKVDDEEDRSRGGYALTFSQTMALIEDVQYMNRANPIPLLLYAIDSTWLRLQEAVVLFHFAHKLSDDSTAVVSRILLRMQSGYESRRLVHIYVGDDTMKLRRLKQRLGSGYNTMLNQYSGFYSLDLSNELDRMCLKRLIEKSVRDMSARRLRGLGDTSQHGHWSCFRNEYHRMVALSGPTVGNHAVKHVIEKNKQQQAQQAKAAAGTTSAVGTSNVAAKVAMSDVYDDGNKVTTNNGTVGVRLADGTWVSDVNALNSAYVDLDRLISPAFCTPIPQRGRLEFDFVNIERPHAKHCHPVHDDVILDCLLLSRLLAEDEIDWAIDKLRYYQKLMRRNVVADGNPMYHADVGRALAVNELVYNMYTSLPHRQSSRKRVFAREAITSQQGVMSWAQIIAAATANAAAAAANGTNSDNNSTASGTKGSTLATLKSRRANTRASAAAAGGVGGGAMIAGSVATGGGGGGRRQRPNANVLGVNKTVSFAAVPTASGAVGDAAGGIGRALSLDFPATVGSPSLEDLDEGPGLTPGSGGANAPLAIDVDQETEEAVKNTIAALFGGDVSPEAIGMFSPAPSDGGRDSPYVDASRPQTPMQAASFDADHSGGGHHAQRQQHKPITFRSFVKQGARAHHKLRRWGARMHEIIVDGTGSDEYKAAALLEFFEAELAPYWLECRQVALILELMAPYGTALRWNYGSYRVEWIVQIFDRIVDLHHFEFIASVLTAEEYAAILCRVGILNIFNPCKCEGAWSLDLGRWEERQVAKMLIHITVDEPGHNWPYKSYQFQRGFLPIPGWELVRRWVTADGLPSKGLLTVDFFTGAGVHLSNCSPDIVLRQMLCALTLTSQRNYVLELELMERDHIYHPEPDGNAIEYDDERSSASSVYPLSTTTATSNAAGAQRTNSLAAFRKVRTKRSMIGRQSLSSSPAPSSAGHGTHASSSTVAHPGAATAASTAAKKRCIKRVIPRIKFTRLRAQLEILRLLSRGTGNDEERARHREQIDKQESIITTAGHVAHPKSIRALHAVLATQDDKYHDVRHFTVEDCNEHLRKEIEATWQYVGNPKCRPETWV